MVSVIVVVYSLCGFLSMCLFVCFCLTVLVNCFLNEFAISVGEVIVFSLKVFFGVVLFCWLIHVICAPRHWSRVKSLLQYG